MSSKDRKLKGNGSSAGESSSSPSQPKGQRELIVMAKPEVGLRATHNGVASISGVDVSSLARLLSSEDVMLQPLFGNEDRLQAAASSIAGAASDEMTDLSVFYHVQAPDERLDELAKRLLNLPEIEAAYVKPAAELAQTGVRPQTTDVANYLNQMAPAMEDVPPATPNFIARQGYLNAAPAGIDAYYAWTQPGGRGTGVRIIDCEWGWLFTHEDLTLNQGGVVVGTGAADINHGTAVAGEISGDVNNVGITGIAPDAVFSAAAFSLPTAQVIRAGADRLSAGDIMLLEIHRPGPNANGQGQMGFIAVEWWPDDWAAIRYATNKGVIVVEAAGNGFQNLDDAIYNTPRPGFPAIWRNPFNRSNAQCGAVMVGAGNPPSGTHGRTQHPNWNEVYVDRARCVFSNFGACVDAQGWGWEVTSTGYGDLQGGMNNRLHYTDQFSGTSSASPIVVGALACVQGVLKAKGRIPLTPARARDLLRSTGSPQQAAPGRPATQRIGNRPNLRQMIPVVVGAVTPWVGVQFRGTLAAGATQRWFTFNWPAHWHVVWTVVPTTLRPGSPQIKFNVQVERASDQFITYWISITNVSPAPCDIEARYAVLGW
ncbi:MAG TPA: S8 family peptidase [Blastocatellia bacterium]|nr:S8 family peptidase [Blastocatellia bacterium]